MKEVNNPQNTDRDDERSLPSPHTLARMRRSSLMSSLRDLIAPDTNETGSNDEDDDDDSFVFTDQIHQRKEFDLLSNTLVGFGLIDRIDDDERETRKMDLEVKEDTPLVKHADLNVVEKNSKTKTETSQVDPIEESSAAVDTLKPIPYRRASTISAYRDGQKESFLAVLDKIDEIENTRRDKGFKEWKFSLGLMNCLLIAYVFGSHPEHFWILYAVETIFWMSYKFRGMCRAKPLCEALYYLDFCWVMNALGVAIIVTFIFLDSCFTVDFIPLEVRKNLFLACFGIFCGPVFMAAMVLPFVAFLFHDVNTMANLIIHLMPSMVMYHNRWHAAEISNAYPTIFRYLASFTEEFNNGERKGSLTYITLTFYFAWFIPYTLWMLQGGLKLPVVSKDKRKPLPKYDTVFHSTWKGGLCELVGTAVWKRPKEVSRDCSERNDYETRDFLLYMAGHAVGSCGIGIIFLGDILCFRGGKTVHATLLWLATIICAKRGADRYTYYVTGMYGQKLRKAFKELEDQQE